MKEPHIYFDGNQAICSICNTGPEQIVDGKSDNYKIHPIFDKYQLAGKDVSYYMDCLKCRKTTKPYLGPYLYY